MADCLSTASVADMVGTNAALDTDFDRLRLAFPEARAGVTGLRKPPSRALTASPARRPTRDEPRRVRMRRHPQLGPPGPGRGGHRICCRRTLANVNPRRPDNCELSPVCHEPVTRQPDNRAD